MNIKSIAKTISEHKRVIIQTSLVIAGVLGLLVSAVAIPYAIESADERAMIEGEVIETPIELSSTE